MLSDIVVNLNPIEMGILKNRTNPVLNLVVDSLTSECLRHQLLYHYSSAYILIDFEGLGERIMPLSAVPWIYFDRSLIAAMCEER